MDRFADNRFDEQEHQVEQPALPESEADDLPVGPSPSSPDLGRQIEDDLTSHLSGNGTPPLREDYGGPRTASDGTQVEPDASADEATQSFDESER